jgi:hypothetical protein
MKVLEEVFLRLEEEDFSMTMGGKWPAIYTNNLAAT